MELSLDQSSWIWLLPQCVHLIIASFITSPTDLYVYTCRAYYIHCRSQHDPGRLGGNVAVLDASSSQTNSYCTNVNTWDWIGAMRRELGSRMQSAICDELTRMQVGFLQGCLERWNINSSMSDNQQTDQNGARVLLSGSVPLCALNGIRLDEHRSDIDLFVSEASFAEIVSDLTKRRFKMVYSSAAHNYAGPFKWRLHRFHRSTPPSDQASIDVIRISPDCLDSADCVRPIQLARSFDLSGCAVTYDGRTTVIPAPEDTLGFRLILRQPYVLAFKKLTCIPHGMSRTTCSGIARLINDSYIQELIAPQKGPRNPHMDEFRLVLAVAWTLHMLRKVIERVIKYSHRGFTIVGSPFHHGVILIDVSVRIEELLHSRIYHRCRGDLPKWYWIYGLRRPSRFLRQFISEFCRTLSGLSRCLTNVDMVMYKDNALGPDARTASRVYRYYLHTRLLSYVRSYVLGRMPSSHAFTPLQDAPCFRHSVAWHRREVFYAYRHLPPLEQNQIRYLIDWQWLLSRTDDENDGPSSRRQRRSRQQLECGLVGANRPGMRPSRTSRAAT